MLYEYIQRAIEREDLLHRHSCSHVRYSTYTVEVHTDTAQAVYDGCGTTQRAACHVWVFYHIYTIHNFKGDLGFTLALT